MCFLNNNIFIIILNLLNPESVKSPTDWFVVRTDAVIGIEMLMEQQIFIKLLIMR